MRRPGYAGPDVSFGVAISTPSSEKRPFSVDRRLASCSPAIGAIKTSIPPFEGISFE
jgi:hypothetical protein